MKIQTYSHSYFSLKPESPSLSLSLFSNWASAVSLSGYFQKQVTALPQPLPSNLKLEAAAGKVFLTVQSFYFYEEINPLSLFSVNNSTFMIRFYLLGERT